MAKSKRPSTMKKAKRAAKRTGKTVRKDARKLRKAMPM